MMTTEEKADLTCETLNGFTDTLVTAGLTRLEIAQTLAVLVKGVCHSMVENYGADMVLHLAMEILQEHGAAGERINISFVAGPPVTTTKQ